MNRDEATKFFSFWAWVIREGWKDFSPSYLLFDLLVGLTLYALIDKPLNNLAVAIILPIIAVLAAICIAWVNGVHDILNSPELEKLDAQNGISLISRYVNKIQLTMLILFASVLLWGLVGTGPWEVFSRLNLWVYVERSKILLFAYTSLAVREAWQGLRAYYMFILQQQILKRIK